MRQIIAGGFQNPELRKQSILTSLAGPALKLLEKGKNILPDGECDIFYAGSVLSSK